ncbi:glycerophosphodiester phosphodiesterase family protein [Actinopolymorpha sp. B17G11]|uniref:glycerophosphodiester phosphodiesterase family protein n=1 Tax=Actinopolymorpha sp. B17G11 TaxID=3160861 RepID=UPI0032E49DA4
MREDPDVRTTVRARREVEVVAHRGASGTAPENTLTALREAAAQGATFAEVDVVLSKDGVPVLAHDLTLERTTNVAEIFPERTTWNVAEFTLAELRMLDAGGWFDQRFAGEHIPTLREALRVFRGHGLGLWMELKSPDRHPRLVQAVADVLRTAPGGWLTAPDRARWLKVTSFNFDVLADFVREVDHAVPVGGITERVPDDATLRELAAWMQYFIPNYRRLRPGDVVRIRSAGLKTGFWTPNDPVAVASLLARGADALIQNYPAVARAMVENRDPVPGPAPVVIERVVGDVPDGGEHVVLRNLTAEPVDVGDWYLRDDPGYRLPIGPDRVIAAGGTLAVYVGHGHHTDGRYYSGLTSTVFSKGGDSVALHRPDGELVDLAGNNLGA